MKMTKFDQAYAEFINKHMKGRKGESLRRLQDRNDHGERLFLENGWWPSIGSLDYLIPEFEVRDFKDGVRFLDYAYLRPPYKLGFEIDGFGPHYRDITRWQFDDHLQRQNDLISDDWKVYRFSYDAIREKPRLIQQSLQQILGKWYGSTPPALHLTEKERKILQFFIGQGGQVTPGDLLNLLDICDKHSRKLLHGLADKGLIKPASGTARVKSYFLDSAALPPNWYNL